MKMGIFWPLTGIIILFIPVTWAHQDSTAPMSSQTMLEEDSTYRDDFKFACQDQKRGRVVSSPFVHYSHSNQDKAQKKLDYQRFQQFLDGLLKSIRLSTSQQSLAAREIANCFSNSKFSRRCGFIVDWAKNVAPDLIKDARFSLGSSTAPFKDAMAINIGFSSTAPNTHLRIPSHESFRIVSWSPLTRDERVDIKKFLENEKKLIKSQIVNENKSLNFSQKQILSEKMRQKRKLQYLEYQNIMATYPILNYVSDPNPSSKSWIYAGQEIHKNSQNELARISKLQGLLSSRSALDPMPVELLNVANYRFHFETFLVKNPQFCDVASSLLKTKNARKKGFEYARNLPVLAASFVLSAGTSAVLGLGSVAVDIGEAQVDGHLLTQQLHGQVFSPAQMDVFSPEADPVAQYSDQTQKKDSQWQATGPAQSASQMFKQRNEFITTLPLEAAGLGVISKTSQYSRRLWRKIGNSQ